VSGKKIDEIVSCFQCSGIAFCYGTKKPELEREEARINASKCTSLHKGRPVETVSVHGFDRGLSRKNAEQLVLDGYARWSCYKTIELIGKLPDSLYKRIKKKHKSNSDYASVSAVNTYW